jgi:hypothetical protein
MAQARLPILARGLWLAIGAAAFAIFVARSVPAAPPPPGSVTPPASPAPSPAAKPAPKPAPPGPSRPAPVRRRPRPEAPKLPAPDVHLTLELPSPDGPWTLHIDNTGAVPVRVLADARLLALEIAPPEPDDDDDDAPPKRRRARPVRCELPADMHPRDSEERALVMPPGRGYAEKFDPRIFCFGTRLAAALVPGATVTPHLVGSRESPAVAAIEEVEPKVASVKDWAGTAASVSAPSAAATPPRATPPPQALAMSTPAFADFALGWEAEVPTTVKDASSQSVALLFRPETVAFDVTGPTGVGVTDPSPTVRCTWPGPAPAPIPELYTHLAPKQQASISVVLNALCPEGALQRPGLYLVRARLETRAASGASVGVRTFTGEVVATATTRLRVRTSNGPSPAAPRPQLVEATPPSAPPSAH